MALSAVRGALLVMGQPASGGPSPLANIFFAVQAQAQGKQRTGTELINRN